VTVEHTVALSPPRGALCVLPKSVSLLLLTIKKKKIVTKFSEEHIISTQSPTGTSTRGNAHADPWRYARSNNIFT